MRKVGPIIMVDSFFRASVLGKALGLTAQAVISHCLTEKHLLIMTAPECLWAYLKDLGNDQRGAGLGFIRKIVSYLSYSSMYINPTQLLFPFTFRSNKL